MLKSSLALKIIIGALIFFSFILVVFKMADPDLGWHLRVGEDELQTKTIPHFDKYSYTMSGFPWVDHEWLVDAWFYFMWSHNLWLLVQIIFSILVFTPFAVWIWRAKSIFHLFFVVIIASVLINFLGVRPQIISFLLFFVVFEILYKYYLNKNTPKNLLLLLPIFFIWANLHAGFFSGIILLALFIMVNLVKNLIDKKVVVRKFYFEVGIFLACILLTFLTPYGIKLYQEIFTVASSSYTTKYIKEWLTSLDFIDFGLALTLACFGLFILKFYKKYPLSLLVQNIFWGLMFLKSIRMEPLFLVVAAPFFFLGIDYTKEEIALSWKRHPPSKRLIKVFTLIFFVIFVSSSGILIYKAAAQDITAYPEKAVMFLKEEVKKKNIVLLNSYGWGGYLIWKLPEIKVFIDGRMPHWIDHNNSAMKDYTKIFYPDKNDSEWQEVFQRRKINTVLIANKKESVNQGIIANYIANNLRQYTWVNELTKFIIRKKTIDLKTVLIKNNWQTTYEDDLAIILESKPNSN